MPAPRPFAHRVLVLCLGLGACGSHALSGSPRDGATDLAARIGPIDLTQAPATLELTCDADVGRVAFKLPCLVGMDVTSGHSGPGLHDVECRLLEGKAPVVWSFLLPLAALANDPSQVLHTPGDLPAVPTDGSSIDLGGQPAQLSSIKGALSFSRIDPEGRAFAGAFAGQAVWKVTASGREITCDLDGPLWGAPGDFL
jgi:hypothetical protein